MLCIGDTGVILRRCSGEISCKVDCRLVVRGDGEKNMMKSEVRGACGLRGLGS